MRGAPIIDIGGEDGEDVAEIRWEMGLESVAVTKPSFRGLTSP